MGQRAIPPQSPCPLSHSPSTPMQSTPGHWNLLREAPSLRSSPPAGLAPETQQCNPGLRTQRDRLGPRRDNGDRRSSVPATGTRTCSSPLAFLALLEPRGSGLLAQYPLPRSGGGTATLPPRQLCSLQGAQQGPRQQWSAEQRLWLAAYGVGPPRGWTGCLLSWSRASALAVHLWARALAPGSLGPGRDLLLYPEPFIYLQPAHSSRHSIPWLPIAHRHSRAPNPPDPHLPAHTHLGSAWLGPPQPLPHQVNTGGCRGLIIAS